MNSGLLFANYACACKIAVLFLLGQFFKSFFGFPNRTVKRKSKNTFLIACKSIRNLDFIKSRSRFPNRTYPLIIAFSPNLRLHLLRQLRLPLLHLLSVLLLATTAICYVVTRLRTGATNLPITLNCCTGNCYCYEL